MNNLKILGNYVDVSQAYILISIGIRGRRNSGFQICRHTENTFIRPLEKILD